MVRSCWYREGNFRRKPNQFMQSMAPRHILVLLPFQALLLFAPAGQAQTIATTKFVPDGYRGSTCRALQPSCMTKQQWANYCRKNYPLHHPWPKSCRDAIASPSQNYPEARTRFLPDNHTGPTCMAFSPSCMTRGQWAQFCSSKKAKQPNWPFPQSCRDALGLRRNVMPKPPFAFVPGSKEGVGMTCLALSEACMGRDALSKLPHSYLWQLGL